MINEYYYCCNCKLVRSFVNDRIALCHVCGNTCIRETIGTQHVDNNPHQLSHLGTISDYDEDDEETLEERCLQNINNLRYQSESPYFQQSQEQTVLFPYVLDNSSESFPYAIDLDEDIHASNDEFSMDDTLSNTFEEVLERGYNSLFRFRFTHMENMLRFYEYRMDTFENQLFDNLVTIIEDIQDISPPYSDNSGPNHSEVKDIIDGLCKIRLQHDDPVLSEECIICQDNLGTDTFTTILPCKHVYHSDCISHWLSIKCSCPVCRQILTHETVLPKETGEVRVLSDHHHEPLNTLVLELHRDIDLDTEEEGEDSGMEYESDIEGYSEMDNESENELHCMNYNARSPFLHNYDYSSSEWDPYLPPYSTETQLTLGASNWEEGQIEDDMHDIDDWESYYHTDEDDRFDDSSSFIEYAPDDSIINHTLRLILNHLPSVESLEHLQAIVSHLNERLDDLSSGGSDLYPSSEESAEDDDEYYGYALF